MKVSLDGSFFELMILVRNLDLVVVVRNYFLCMVRYSNQNKNLLRMYQLRVSTTCYKNVANLTCNDFIWDKLVKYFENSNVTEAGLSDFHDLVVKGMKMSYRRLDLKAIDS